MQTTPAVDWAAAQIAVAGAAARASALVRSIRRPEAPALGAWSVIEVATHLSHAMDGVMGLAKGGGGVLQDIWELGDLTGALLRGESERDPAVLADRIDASVARFLTYMREAGDDAARTWFLPGIQVGLSTITCHALNELVVHGRDIAMAEGQPWPLSGDVTRMIVCGFLFPALGGLGRAMVNQETAGDLRASFEVRVRGGGGAVLRFDHGDLVVEEGRASGPVDCHLSVEPTAFLLVAWGRISQWGPIARGQLVAWGRRPWLGPRFRSLLRNA